MGGYSLPSRTIREMICASIDVIVHGSRLRDRTRRITHITEIVGMEGDVITTQDLLIYDIAGEDANGNLIGKHKSTGIGHPKSWDRARYYGEEKRLAAALDAAEVAQEPLRDGEFNRSTQHPFHSNLAHWNGMHMQRHARTWFTPKLKAEP